MKKTKSRNAPRSTASIADAEDETAAGDGRLLATCCTVWRTPGRSGIRAESFTGGAGCQSAASGTFRARDPLGWPGRDSGDDGRPSMELSARNQLKGKIKEVKRGTVVAEVSIEVGGGQTIVSTISLASVDRMKLKEGDAVTAFIKASEVIVGK